MVRTWWDFGALVSGRHCWALALPLWTEKGGEGYCCAQRGGMCGETWVSLHLTGMASVWVEDSVGRNVWLCSVRLLKSKRLWAAHTNPRPVFNFREGLGKVWASRSWGSRSVGCGQWGTPPRSNTCSRTDSRTHPWRGGGRETPLFFSFWGEQSHYTSFFKIQYFSIIKVYYVPYRNISGTSLVAQWLRIHLPMQGTRVQSLVWEDPTCCGAAKPVSHNTEPTCHNYWTPCT